MPTENTYNRILAYLKGLLSNRQRHALEKDMMNDVFEEEAFEGLSQLSASDLEKDLAFLQKRLENRVLPVRKNRRILYLRLAAGIALLFGVGSLLYFMNRTPGHELITERKKIEKPVVQPAPPVISVQPEPGNEGNDKPLQQDQEAEKSQKKPEQPGILTDPGKEAMPGEMILPEQAAPTERIASEPESKSAAPERKEEQEPIARAASEMSKSPTRMKTTTATAGQGRIFSGTVVDNSGETLPGVVVTETGTNNVTLTDENGQFSLTLKNSNASLAFNFIGYKTIEMDASGEPKDRIVMEEDLVALDEVVVVGYGTRKKADVTGSVSTVRINDDPPQYPVYTRPVPPGGTLRAFKKWVTDRLDYAKYSDYPGKYKMDVEFTVHANGTISNIRVEQNTPAEIVNDLKKIVSQSSLWSPGLKDNQPLDTVVEIHFVITVE